MPDEHGGKTPVKTRAILIDPLSMTIVWMNEAAAKDLSGKPGIGSSVEKLVPLSSVLGLPEALRAAADTGLPRHLWTDIVSTSRGTMGMSASVYRLPDGKLLLLIEEAWRMKRAGV